MVTLSALLLVIAFVCFVIAVFWNPPRIALVPLGLALWVLSVLLAGGIVKG